MGKNRTAMTGDANCPTPCPHCHKFVFNPAAWIRVVEAMYALKTKYGAAVANGAALASHFGVSRERGRQLLLIAHQVGVIEPFIQYSGVYKPSQKGYTYYRQWRKAGWEGKRVDTQTKLRTGFMQKGLKKSQRHDRKGGVNAELAAAIAVLEERVADKEAQDA